MASRPQRSAMLAALYSRDLMGPAECPCCGYGGLFEGFGRPLRTGVMCPKCRSLERHRLFHLAHREGLIGFAGADVLHFAPERFIAELVRADQPNSYVTADIEPGRADLVLNLEAINRPEASSDIVVASHVLEHVDDARAMSELHRILRPGGKLVAMVPLIEGWSGTYEDPAITGSRDRFHHFGQEDHVRFYGADFRDRLRKAGFELTEYEAGGSDSVRYRLQRGEKVFLAAKA
jgi:SAM-dependent methyltransferase